MLTFEIKPSELKRLIKRCYPNISSIRFERPTKIICSINVEDIKRIDIKNIEVFRFKKKQLIPSLIQKYKNKHIMLLE